MNKLLIDFSGRGGLPEASVLWDDKQVVACK